ncbi:MAG: hypothetical protein WAZ27_02715, partial [Minisyncoccia bacterium]
LDADGLTLSGSPSITSLSNGDFELSANGGTMLTVGGTVVDANPLKIFTRNSFATSSGITSGTNVTATGSTGSSWKFNLHYGNYDGESFDTDPAGDPGYIRWDDSASDIVVSGNVYSDEGSSVSAVCDNATPVVVLKVAGAGSYTSVCDGSGSYSIPGVFFNPGDTLTLFLNTNGGVRAANVSVDPNTNISNMNLYENRVIVRHEDTTPLTIAQMAAFDSDDDTDIPFTATDAGTDTLVLRPNTKLILWTGKTFAPAGDITLQSGGSGAVWDGSLELFANSVFSAAGTQSHSIGGSLTVGSGASISSANSTFTFTATTTGKTIAPGNSSFYTIVFNGTGGNWAFAGPATSTNDFTITAGTVTLSSATTTIAGSFENTGGTFMHNNGTVQLTSTATGKNIRPGSDSFYNLTLNGSGGGWSFVGGSATTSRHFTVNAGSVTLPNTLTIGGSFTNAGTVTHNSGTIVLTSTLPGRTILASGSSLYNVTFNGSGGEWTWSDTSATTNNLTITAGSTTLPAGTLSVAGSFVNSAGSFNNNTGTVRFTATTAGKSITPNGSWFSNLTFDGIGGGWTITENATSSGNTTITNATSLTQTSGT